MNTKSQFEKSFHKFGFLGFMVFVVVVLWLIGGGFNELFKENGKNMESLGALFTGLAFGCVIATLKMQGEQLDLQRLQLEKAIRSIDIDFSSKAIDYANKRIKDLLEDKKYPSESLKEAKRQGNQQEIQEHKETLNIFQNELDDMAILKGEVSRIVNNYMDEIVTRRREEYQRSKRERLQRKD